MSMQDLEEAFQVIETHREQGDFAGEQAESLVEAAEQALGFAFPPTYRHFVLRFGGGDVAGVEIYGVTTSNFASGSIPNGVWLTLQERLRLALPPALILVFTTDDGDYLALDSSRQTADGEYPVVRFRPGVDRSGDDLEVVAADFGALARQLLEAAT